MISPPFELQSGTDWPQSRDTTSSGLGSGLGSDNYGVRVAFASTFPVADSLSKSRDTTTSGISGDNYGVRLIKA